MFWRIYVIHAIVIAAVIGLAGAVLLPSASTGRIVLVALAGAATAVLPARLIVRYYARPLRQLANLADAVAAGDLNRRVYVGATGDVRSLAQASNAMSERLAERFARLEDDRGRLRGILEGMVEGVIALDAADAIVFANERAGQLLDFPPERVEGRKFWEVVRQRPLQELVNTAATTRAPQRAELDWPGATPRSLALYAAPLAGGKSVGLIIVVHDVSELRRLENMRQEFVANVSHELKTPLAVIKASIETLMDGAVDDLEHRGPFLEQIEDQADRLHALILDLLRLARIESQAERYQPTIVDIEPLVSACLDRHRARAEARGVRLAAISSPGLAAWADEEGIETILDNLVDNAIKYTPAGGSVEVRSTAQAGIICVEVADTGVGIPELDLPRVFERFYRVDKARAREVGGTGLGLAIVKHLIQRMAGTVTATSTVGQGSTFKVCWPAPP